MAERRGDIAGRSVRPAGAKRDRSPEQIERDRARSRAWHARQRSRLLELESTAGRPATISGRPATGREHVDRPDADTQTADLVARVTALEAELSELRELREWRERERQRSRRNRQLKRAPTPQSTAGAGTVAIGAGRDRSPADRVPAPPPTQHAVKAPPESVPDLAVAAASRGVEGGQQQQLRASSPDAIWQSAEVREAIAARPGLDILAERRKLEAWLRDEARQDVSLSARLVLSWLDRAQPIHRGARDAQPQARRREERLGPAPSAYAWDPWGDRPPPIAAERAP